MTSACPVCRADASYAFSLGPFTVCTCPNCSHQFCPDAASADHVGTVYDDTYFFGGGNGYDDYLKDADLLRAQGARYGRLLASYCSVGRVLDVGSAAGFILSGLQDAGWTGTGLEPNATMVAHATGQGLNAHVGTLEDTNLGVFDAICLIQVIGHFHDMSRAISNASASLAPGGVCLVEFWNRSSWIARLLGRRWHEYSPPSVLHWFTRESLDHLMGLHGLSPIASGKPTKYISGRHAKSLLSHKVPALKVPLRAIPDGLRIRYPTWDLAWSIYRKDPS